MDFDHLGIEIKQQKEAGVEIGSLSQINPCVQSTGHGNEMGFLGSDAYHSACVPACSEQGVLAFDTREAEKSHLKLGTQFCWLIGNEVVRRKV